MNSRLLLAFLCARLVVHRLHHPRRRLHNCGGNPPWPSPATSTFLWIFDGLRCDEARDVYGVNITIPGEALLNDGRYACSTNGADGITLHDFAPGTYSFQAAGGGLPQRGHLRGPRAPSSSTATRR